MKKNKFLKHLRDNGCLPTGRQKGSHAWFRNTLTGKATVVPMHNDINDLTCATICTQLGIPSPSKN